MNLSKGNGYDFYYRLRREENNYKIYTLNTYFSVVYVLIRI